MKRLLSFTIISALALALTACGGSSNSFTWFVDTIPANLDPQVASLSADVIACTNLYGGLVRKTPEGELETDLCESYTVSSDRLTYTFRLKSDLYYLAKDGKAAPYAITAEDFVFAFRRVFRRGTASPYAADFTAIANSAAVLAGEAAESTLGVSAADTLTLVIRLSEPDNNFLEKLTLPGAMPCDEEFFDSTRGTYGLTSATTISSGSFYLSNWTSSGLFLRRAAQNTAVDTVRLVQNTTSLSQSPAQLIANEKCSAALDTGGEATTLRALSYTDTTWALVYNCDSVFGCTPLRQALSAEALATELALNTALYTDTEGLVPAGVSVDGVDYRQRAGRTLPVLDDPAALYAAALSEVSTAQLKTITLLIPADRGVSQLAEAMNSAWQKELSLFFSIEEVDSQTFEKRLADGSYTLALAPLTLEKNDALSFLSDFSADGLTGYAGEDYAALLAEAAATSGTARYSALIQAERTLLQDCALTPLFSQQKRLLLADGLDGLVFNPFGPVIDLTYATKE